VAGLLDTTHYEGNLISKIEELERRLMALEHTELSGVAGPVGATGATGATGPAGPGTPAGVAQGDVIYFDATPEAVVLNIGAAEQVLRTNAGAQAPEWSTIDNDSIADRTRTLFVPAVECYNVTDTSYQNRSLRGWEMIDAKHCQVYGAFRMPSDWSSGGTLQSVFIPGGTGNIYALSLVDFANVGQAYNTHTLNTGWQTEAVVDTIVDQFTTPLTLTNVDAGDYVICDFRRDATNVADTISATLYFVGFLVSYTADM